MKGVGGEDREAESRTFNASQPAFCVFCASPSATFAHLMKPT